MWVALKMYFVGSLTSFESCEDKPKSGIVAKDTKEDTKSKIIKANEDHHEAEKSLQKLRKIQDERDEIKKIIETNNTLSLKGKTQENIIDLIQMYKDEFIRHADFPTEKNANKNS